MEQIQESSFELSVSRVTQSIDLDDTIAVEDANIVVESSLLVTVSYTHLTLPTIYSV